MHQVDLSTHDMYPANQLVKGLVARALNLATKWYCPPAVGKLDASSARDMALQIDPAKAAIDP